MKLVNVKLHEPGTNWWWHTAHLYPLPNKGLGGQRGNAIKIRGELLQWIKDLNRNDPVLLHWLIKERDDAIYLTENGEHWENAEVIYWPMIAIGGNSIVVDEQQVKGRGGMFYRVLGLKSYSATAHYDFFQSPELVHRVYCGNKAGHVTDVPGRGVAFMPIFDPSSFPVGCFTGDPKGKLKNNPDFGLYIRVSETEEYNPEYPIPLPENWNLPGGGGSVEPVPEYIVVYQARVVGANGWPRGTLGVGRTFTLSGTKKDSKGRIWGNHAGGRWVLLYDPRKKLYLTTWRMK